jgi:dTDP-4-amino-4,6-dideoxy-D-galactose acyltransferase
MHGYSVTSNFHTFKTQRNDWESRFFQLEIWTIQSGADGTSSLQELLGSESGVDIWETKISIAETELIAEFLGAGFFLSDSACDFAIDLKNFERPRSTSHPITYTATANDIPKIEKLLEQADFPTRFTREPFKTTDAGDFYKTWARNAIEGTFDDLCLVAEIDGQIAALLTLKKFNDEDARIGIVLTRTGLRRSGLGTSLHFAAAQIAKDWGKLRLRVSTQMTNRPMMGLIPRLGGRLLSTELCFYRVLQRR